MHIHSTITNPLECTFVVYVMERVYAAEFRQIRPNQCFCFQKKNELFLDTLIQTRFFKIMKINNFRGGLIDTSA